MFLYITQCIIKYTTCWKGRLKKCLKVDVFLTFLISFLNIIQQYVLYSKIKSILGLLIKK